MSLRTVRFISYEILLGLFQLKCFMIIKVECFQNNVFYPLKKKKDIQNFDKNTLRLKDDSYT